MERDKELVCLLNGTNLEKGWHAVLTSSRMSSAELAQHRNVLPGSAFLLGTL